MDAWEDYVEWWGLDETVLGGERHARNAGQFSRSDSPAAGTRQHRPLTESSRCRRALFAALRRRTG